MPSSGSGSVAGAGSVDATVGVCSGAAAGLGAGTVGAGFGAATGGAVTVGFACPFGYHSRGTTHGRIIRDGRLLSSGAFRGSAEPTRDGWVSSGVTEERT